MEPKDKRFNRLSIEQTIFRDVAPNELYLVFYEANEAQAFRDWLTKKGLVDFGGWLKEKKNAGELK